jgi:hypothetical protein
MGEKGENGFIWSGSRKKREPGKGYICVGTLSRSYNNVVFAAAAALVCSTQQFTHVEIAAKHEMFRFA